MRSLCSLLNVKQIFTSSRHPQTNSRAESYNTNIFNSLRTRWESEPNWPALLSTIGNSFRTFVAKNLGVSPYALVFGRKTLLPIDHMLILPQNIPTSAKCYFDNMKPQLKILRQAVRQNQLQSNRDTKKAHDAHCNVKTPNCAVGDRVWLNEQLPSKVKLGHKTSQKFKGSYLIVEANPEYYTYKLQNCKNNKIHSSLIHVNRLRLCDTERDGFYSKNVMFDAKTSKNGDTIPKTATESDSAMEIGRKQADATGSLALPLQTNVDTTAAATAAKQETVAEPARKHRSKQRVFHRSKIASGNSQAAATAQCADTAVSKQTTKDTRTLTDNTLPTLTGSTQT